MEVELRFSRRDGTTAQLRLPDREDADAREVVNTAADAVFDEFQLRVNSARRSQNSASYGERRARKEPIDWFRPIAYQLIATCLERKVEQHLFWRNKNWDRYISSNTAASSDFGSGLMAITAKHPPVMGDGQRSKMGLLLWYAYRHYVPSCFINGFAQQVGELNVEKARSFIEPNFEDWIVERRVLDFGPSRARGPYPRRIEDRVNHLRSSNAPHLGLIFEALAAEDDELE